MKLFKSCEDGVHKFEARYDEFPPTLEELYTNLSSLSTNCIRSLTKEVYVKDVCVKCGKEIKR